MKPKRLGLFAVIAAVLLIGAFWADSTRKPTQEVVTDSALLPGLLDDVNKVDKIRLIGVGDKPLVTLERKDDQWTMTDKGGYPADIGKVREFLLSLAQAKRVEAKTSDPALYSRLGVEDINKAEAAGIRAEISAGGKTYVAIIGKGAASGKGTYARPGSGAHSWLTDRTITIDRAPANWLVRDVTDIAATRVKKAILGSGDNRIEIVRDEAAGRFTLTNLPKGREMASEYAADGTAGLLSSLSLDDVQSVVDVTQPSDAKPIEARYQLDNGVIVNLSGWKTADNKTWLRFNADIDEAAASAFIEREQARAKGDYEAQVAAQKQTPSTAKAGPGGIDAPKAEEVQAASNAPVPATAQQPLTPPLAVSDPAADKTARHKTIEDEAAKLNQRFNQWLFSIPAYKASNLDKTLESYLKPKNSKA